MIVYYINYDGINCSVYESQIYTYCQILSENNLKVTLINCDINIDSKEYKHKMDKYLNYDNLRVISLEKNEKFDFLIKKNLVNEVVKTIKDQGLKSEKRIIHCRGLFGSFIGLKVRAKLKNNFNIKIISDIRGAVIDEYLMRHKDKGRIYKMILTFLMVKINSIQSFVCKNSDYILCVSKKLEEYLKNRHKVNCNVSVIPTCIDEGKNRFDLDERTKIRTENNLENKFIVAYCGGGQGYQQPSELVNAFRKISERVEDAFFLILTRDSEIFEKSLNEVKVDKSKYLIRAVSHNEVYKYLSASDCAILLRENNNVNKVASPTKFAEYINCNLPVFISHNIGDLDEINAKYNICIYEEHIDSIRNKISEIKKNEENYKLVIDDYYGWNKRIRKIISIYKEL
jgi:glycosyltransferase involved in cell wall biosynthesis